MHRRSLSPHLSLHVSSAARTVDPQISFHHRWLHIGAGRDVSWVLRSVCRSVASHIASGSEECRFWSDQAYTALRLSLCGSLESRLPISETAAVGATCQLLVRDAPRESDDCFPPVRSSLGKSTASGGAAEMENVCTFTEGGLKMPKSYLNLRHGVHLSRLGVGVMFHRSTQVIMFATTRRHQEEQQQQGTCDQRHDATCGRNGGVPKPCEGQIKFLE